MFLGVFMDFNVFGESAAELKYAANFIQIKEPGFDPSM